MIRILARPGSTTLPQANGWGSAPLRDAIWRWLVASVLLAGAAGARAENVPTAQLFGVAALDQWGNLQGGLKRGSVALVSAQLGLEIDAERAFGWRGATMTISGIYDDRSIISSGYVGDLHGVDNRDGGGGARVYEVSARQAFGGGYGKVGLIDLNSEFSVNRTGALFVNGSHGIGLEMEQLGWTGPSIYPQPRAGIVAALGRDAATWKAGVFSGAAAPTRAGGARTHAFPLLGVLERSGPIAWGGRVTLGAWAHTADYGDTFASVTNRAGAGAYLLVEQPFWRGGARELSGFARVGLANPRIEPIAQDVNFGLTLAQPFGGDEGEALGLAVLSSRNGRLRPAPADNAAPASLRETVVEATLRLPVGQGLALQPDIQYIVHPGAVPGRRNAVVIGLRIEGAWRAGF